MYETKNVKPIPMHTIIKTIKVASKLDFRHSPAWAALVKNIVAIVIKKGNLPLQGTHLLVRMAISLSL